MQGVSLDCTELPVQVRISLESSKETQLTSILLQRQLYFMGGKNPSNCRKR